MGIESTLFPGATVLAKKPADAIVSLQEHGVEHLDGTGWVMGRIGFAGKEAIGGVLHLTDRRLLFVSHPMKQIVGQMSLLLPAIVDVTDVSGLITKRMRVRTHALESEFATCACSTSTAERLTA